MTLMIPKIYLTIYGIAWLGATSPLAFAADRICKATAHFKYGVGYPKNQGQISIRAYSKPDIDAEVLGNSTAVDTYDRVTIPQITLPDGVNTIYFRVNLTGAEGFEPQEPLIPQHASFPIVLLGELHIVKKAEAFKQNADAADLAKEKKLTGSALEAASFKADAALDLAKDYDQKLRATRAKAALLTQSGKALEAVTLLSELEPPKDQGNKKVVLQERFDAYEAAVKSLGGKPDKLGLVSGALDNPPPAAESGDVEILQKELAALSTESQAFWPQNRGSFEDKRRASGAALKSEALANENVVRISLQRNGVADLKSSRN